MKTLFAASLLLFSLHASAQLMVMKKAAHSSKSDAGGSNIMDTYLIDFEKSTYTWFQIDSVKTISGKKKLDYAFFKVVMTATPNDVSWRYDSLGGRDSTSGLFQLRIRKVPASKNTTVKTKAENEKADFSKGLIIYCTDNRQKQQIKIESWFELGNTEQR